jgi:hypothetical protein
LNFTEQLKADFLRHNKVNIQVPNELSQNYLKIITNVFYLNLQKVCIDVKNDIIVKGEKLSRDAMKQIIAVYYEKHLKLTRRTVLQYFNVKSDTIKPRTLLRAYTNLLSKQSPERSAYLSFYELKEKIEENLADGMLNEELTSEVYKEPRDEVINLENLVIK